MRNVPFSLEQIEDVIQEYPTPFHIYDEAAIRAHAVRFREAFAWVPDTDGTAGIDPGTGHPAGFTNFYAVKALPNPHILTIVREEGMGFDCSSYAELELVERLGVRGEEIIFTSNDTPAYEYAKAKELGRSSTSTISATSTTSPGRSECPILSACDTTPVRSRKAT
jgi:diaminopimelate decarboxylase